MKVSPNPSARLRLTAPLTEFPPLSSSVWSLTFENGTDVLPYGYGSGPVELSQRQLHVEERHATENGHQDVWNEEGTCGERGGRSRNAMVGVRAW